MPKKLLIGCAIIVALTTVLAFAGWLKMTGATMRGAGITTDPAEQQQAISALSEQIRKQPSNAALYARRATAYSFATQYDLALRDWDKATYLDPSNPTYPYLKGMCLETAGRRSEAITSYRRALQIIDASPSSPDSRAVRDGARGRLEALGVLAP